MRDFRPALAIFVALSTSTWAELPSQRPFEPRVPKTSKHLKWLLRDLARKEKLPASSSGVARGDFNGDGFADLAVGIPSEDSGSGVSASGAVVVIYGSATGLTTAPAAGVPAPQFWSQGTSGVSGSDEAADRFGTALASGEFNGDAFSDLAIGIPGEDLTSDVDGRIFPNTGRVVVIYGSANGLAATGTGAARSAQSFDLVNGAMPTIITDGIKNEILPANARVGQALAWGDFNGDGIGDLAVGAPGMAVKDDTALFADSEAGQVWVLFGQQRNGLVRAGSQLLTQRPGKLGDGGRSGWHNGAALAAGDFNGDGVSELVVSAPDATLGIFFGEKREVGMCTVFPGVAGSGLDWDRGRFFSIGVFGIEGRAGDHFGSAFAVGDFDKDGKADLAIGVPDMPGRRTVAADGSIVDRDSDAGAVFVRFGHSSGFFAADTLVLDQNVLFGAGREAGDRFGHALASGDFNGDGFADLAIGAPGENFPSISDGGEVDVIYGSPAGPSPTLSLAAQRFTDTTLQNGAQFGRALSAWNFGRDERVTLPFINLTITLRTADLVVGVPFKDITGQVDAGAVHIFYGSGAGVTVTGEQEWTQNSPNIPGASEGGDIFGSAVY